MIDNITTCPMCSLDASFMLTILFPLKPELVVIGRMQIASV